MVTTATIDLISYTASATDTASKSKSDNASASGFDDIFAGINKNYASKEYDSSESAVVSKNFNEKHDKVENKTQKTEDDSNVSEDKSKVTDDNSQKVNEKEEDTSKNSSSESKSASDEKSSKSEVSGEDKAAEQVDKTSDDSTNSLSEEELANKLKEYKAKFEEITKNMENVPDISSIKDIKTIEKLLESLIAQTGSQQKEDSTTSTDAVQQSTEINAVDLLMANVQDSSAIAKNASNSQVVTDVVSNSANKNIKVQPQTQQALSNVEVEQEQVVQAQIPTEAIQGAELETPVVAVSTEAMAQEVDFDPNSKQNIKGTVNKSLTQDVLDKTNAKVESVETSGASNSNSNSNNLLNNQNSQEQVIKLSLQSADAGNNVDILPTIDSSAQAGSFAKTLDNVGTVQANQAKELSQSDILSQINSKLDNLQDAGTTKVTIVLRPENLGKISLELVNGKDGLVAKMTTDNAQVKELLDKSLDSLKDNLANQGVSVNNVTVKVDETQKQSNDMFSFDNRQAKDGEQEFSGNSQSQSENKSFNDEMESFNNTSMDTESDEQVSDNSYDGQVNYRA